MNFNIWLGNLKKHPNRYEIYFRMTKGEFNFLHDLIRDDIKTRNTLSLPTSSPESQPRSVFKPSLG